MDNKVNTRQSMGGGMMERHDDYTKDWDVIEADFMDPRSPHTPREWWAYDEICHLREKVDAIKKDRDQGWHNFMKLRESYGQFRYPELKAKIDLMATTVQGRVILNDLLDTSDGSTSGDDGQNPVVTPTKPSANE